MKIVEYEDSKIGETVLEGIPIEVEEPFFDVVQYHSSGIFRSSPQVPYGLESIQMKDFEYDDSSGLIEISVDGYHISINRKLVYLQSSLPEPIADVSWLPSIFYFSSRR